MVSCVLALYTSSEQVSSTAVELSRSAHVRVCRSVRSRWWCKYEPVYRPACSDGHLTSSNRLAEPGVSQGADASLADELRSSYAVVCLLTSRLRECQWLVLAWTIALCPIYDIVILAAELKTCAERKQDSRYSCHKILIQSLIGRPAYSANEMRYSC